MKVQIFYGDIFISVEIKLCELLCALCVLGTNDADIEVNVIDINSTISVEICLLYTSPSPRDLSTSRMPSSA